jgi:hypothetical protein
MLAHDELQLLLEHHHVQIYPLVKAAHLMREALRGTQRHSVVLGGTQWHSVALRGTLLLGDLARLSSPRT